jgi:hypothetical protein
MPPTEKMTTTFYENYPDHVARWYEQESARIANFRSFNVKLRNLEPEILECVSPDFLRPGAKRTDYNLPPSVNQKIESLFSEYGHRCNDYIRSGKSWTNIPNNRITGYTLHWYGKNADKFYISSNYSSSERAQIMQDLEAGLEWKHKEEQW